MSDWAPDLSIPKFYAGSHRPGWLWDGTIDFPLMVSDRRLREKANHYPATVPGWCLDSGGFTELMIHGRWTVSGREYVERVARYDREIGHLEWAAPRDLMCEEVVRKGGTLGRMTFAGTGLTEEQHQRLTVQNYVEDTALWGEYSGAECPIIPVLQGGEDVASYERCYRFYEEAGVDLSQCFLVGVGSVCRRQSAREISDLTRVIGQMPVVTHWFGVKLTGVKLSGMATAELREDGDWIENGPASLDSLAWSDWERREEARAPGSRRRPECAHAARSCSGCRVACREYHASVVAALRAARDAARERRDARRELELAA